MKRFRCYFEDRPDPFWIEVNDDGRICGVGGSHNGADGWIGIVFKQLRISAESLGIKFTEVPLFDPRIDPSQVSNA